MDDSTGVINCLCWKDEKWKDQGEPIKCKLQKLSKFTPIEYNYRNMYLESTLLFTNLGLVRFLKSLMLVKAFI